VYTLKNDRTTGKRDLIGTRENHVRPFDWRLYTRSYKLNIASELELSAGINMYEIYANYWQQANIKDTQYNCSMNDRY